MTIDANLDEDAQTLIVAAALLEYVERELLCMNVVPADAIKTIRAARETTHRALLDAGVTEEMRRSALSRRR